MVNKIWYLSDLDNTLIYTKRKILKHHKKNIPFYYKDDKEYSFIEENTLEFMENLWNNNNISFIPITARNFKSYSNTLFYKNENIPHFILNHGSEIYVDRELDKEWQQIMNKKYNNLKYKIKDLLTRLESLNYKNKLEIIKTIDNYYIKMLWFEELEEKTELEFREILNNEFKDLEEEYKVVKDGRVWFFKPKFLNKVHALKYLKNKYKPELLFGSGDSDSDVQFIKLCDFQVIPKNAYINKI